MSDQPLLYKADQPIGTVLVHPDDNPAHPDARRLIRRAVGPEEWPWTRLTGWPGDLPARWSDLSHWVKQPLRGLADVLGHPQDTTTRGWRS